MTEKRRQPDGKEFRVFAQIKREWGEGIVRPTDSSHFRIERSSCYRSPNCLSLGGQNLAALCTATGKNLTTVGSSHSLAETVNLGAVTAAGLIGTLHVRYTSSKINMLDSRQNRPQRNIFKTIIGHARVL